jgi:hypothetical protein
MSDSPSPNKPLVSYSVGPLSVSLWENDVEGKERKFKSVTIRKTFTNRDGQPDARTVSINTAEVGCLAGLLTRMEEAVIQQQAQDPF